MFCRVVHNYEPYQRKGRIVDVWIQPETLEVTYYVKWDKEEIVFGYSKPELVFKR